MNLILMQRGYIPVVVKQQDRNSYYQVLRQADAREFQPIVDYIGGLEKHSLDIYLRGARGESIEEADDIDKEIALFKTGFSEDKVLLRKNSATIQDVLNNSIHPLQRRLFDKISQFRELFFDYNEKIVVSDDWNKNNFDSISVFDSIPHDIYEIRIILNLEGFKKVESPFDYQIVVPWRLEEYYYRISDTSFTHSEVRKKYNEYLSVSEIENITRYAAKKVLEDLKARSEK